jgi:hypothetical protein
VRVQIAVLVPHASRVNTYYLLMVYVCVYVYVLRRTVRGPGEQCEVKGDMCATFANSKINDAVCKALCARVCTCPCVHGRMCA